MLSLSRQIPGNFCVIEPSLEKSKIVQVTENLQCRENFHRFFTAFRLFYSIQTLLIFYHFYSGAIRLSGSLFICLIYQKVTTGISFVTYSFLLNKAPEFCDMINQLYSEKAVTSSKALRVYMIGLRYSIVLGCLGYIVLKLVQQYEPMEFALVQGGYIKAGWVLMILKCVVTVYDSWNCLVVLPLATLMDTHGMLSSYLAILLMARVLFKDRCCLPEKIRSLNQLRIRTIFVNACFQQRVSISVKLIIMSAATFCGAALMNKSFRNASDSFTMSMVAHGAITLYGVMLIGYFSPGSANRVSEEILGQCNILNMHASQSSHQRKVMRRLLNSLQPVRIKFGSVNYYEKGTSISLLGFMFEQTASISLLME